MALRLRSENSSPSSPEFASQNDRKIGVFDSVTFTLQDANRATEQERDLKLPPPSPTAQRHQAFKSARVFEFAQSYALILTDADRPLLLRLHWKLPSCLPSARLQSFYLDPPSHNLPALEQFGLLFRWEAYLISAFILQLLFRLARLSSSLPSSSPPSVSLSKVATTYQPRQNPPTTATPPHPKIALFDALLIRWDGRLNQLFWLGCAGLFLFSCFEIVMQPAFTNDWPAHLHHIEQWRRGIPYPNPITLDSLASSRDPPQPAKPPAPPLLPQLSYDWDYEHFMHYHGPCTYPVGFLYLYHLLYWLTGGSLQLFQLVWAVLEVVALALVRQLSSRLGLGALPPLLALASNRLHLYNVRVVINELPSIVLLLLLLNQLHQRKWTRGALLYSLLLLTKLNFIFYAPAVGLLYLHFCGLLKSIRFGLLFLAVQVLPALPFLLENPRAYLTIAYDLGRGLLWEKTRQLKFVGRDLYQSPALHVLLLGATAACILSVLYLWFHRRQVSLDRLTVTALLYSNFAFITFSRGLYTPFLSWYFYTYPLLLRLLGLSPLLTALLWFLQELLFRPFSSLETELWATLILFLLNVFVTAQPMLALLRPASHKPKLN